MSDFFTFLSANPVLSLLLLGTLVAWTGWELKQLRRKHQVIAPQRLVELLNRERAYVIDLNENNQYLKHHIDGAINIPLGDFSPSHKSIKAEKTQAIVVYDAAGLKAESVAEQLAAAGFTTLFVLDGGLDNWQRERFPTVKGR
jgi:rhodanese-related sulfurtransferase